MSLVTQYRITNTVAHKIMGNASKKLERLCNYADFCSKEKVILWFYYAYILLCK